MTTSRYQDAQITSRIMILRLALSLTYYRFAILFYIYCDIHVFCNKSHRTARNFFRCGEKKGSATERRKSLERVDGGRINLHGETLDTEIVRLRERWSRDPRLAFFFRRSLNLFVSGSRRTGGERIIQEHFRRRTCFYLLPI